MVSHRKSYTDVLPEKSGRSLALCCICIRSTGSSFLPCGSRGVILLTNQWLCIALPTNSPAFKKCNYLLLLWWADKWDWFWTTWEQGGSTGLPNRAPTQITRVLSQDSSQWTVQTKPLVFVLVTVYSVPLLSAIANPWISVVLSSFQWQVPHTARQLFTRSLFSCSKGKFPTNVFIHSWNTEDSFQPASSASLTKIYFH